MDFYINPSTTLTINPSTPDGLNGWYVTSPTFTLENSDAIKIFYEWDSTGEILIYSGPFGFEDAPNNQNVTGGIVDLNYWSEFLCGKNETKNTELIKADFSNPEFKNLVPEEDSIIYNSKPEISVYVDEVYQSNSGIDLLSIIIEVNEIDVTSEADISPAGSLDATVTYTPLIDLPLGKNNVTIFAKDNSGRDAELTWSFVISEQPEFNLLVYSPAESLFDSRRILFDLTTNQEADELEYIDYSDKNPRWKRLCRNCDSYSREKSFSDGVHNLTIRATDEFGNVAEKNVSFLIDSKVPRISRTEPRNRAVSNGEDFYIKFNEDNPKELNLILNSTDTLPMNLSNCVLNKNYYECFFDIDLTSYDGEEIEYYFELEDIVGNKGVSRPTQITADTTPPSINNPEDFYSNDSRYIYFNISIIEENLDEVTLSYEYERNGKLYEKEKRLCSRLKDGICEKKFRYQNYYESFQLNVFDKADNLIGIPVVLN